MKLSGDYKSSKDNQARNKARSKKVEAYTNKYKILEAYDWKAKI